MHVFGLGQDVKRPRNRFPDENDWNVYYWAAQKTSPNYRETANGAGPGPEGATQNTQGKDKMSALAQGTDPAKQRGPELETAK
jgi:hypothetical protein